MSLIRPQSYFVKSVIRSRPLSQIQTTGRKPDTLPLPRGDHSTRQSGASRYPVRKSQPWFEPIMNWGHRVSGQDRFGSTGPPPPPVTKQMNDRTPKCQRGYHEWFIRDRTYLAQPSHQIRAHLESRKSQDRHHLIRKSFYCKVSNGWFLQDQHPPTIPLLWGNHAKIWRKIPDWWPSTESKKIPPRGKDSLGKFGKHHPASNTSAISRHSGQFVFLQATIQRDQCLRSTAPSPRK